MEKSLETIKLANREQIIYTLLKRISKLRGLLMKGITLIALAIILSSCCYPRTTYIVPYRQVAVTPVLETVVVDYPEPVDVTTTTIDFY